MQEQYIYTILDEKSCEFSPPFFTLNDNMAKRMVMESMRGNGNMLTNYPEDFKLYVIGSFDKMTGHIVALDKPKLVVNVKELQNIMNRRNNNADNS